MTESPFLDESLPLETGDPAEAIAAVPSPSGYRAMLQALFRGKLTGAAIALVIRQVVVMVLSVGSSVAVSRWLGPEVVGRFAILIFVTQGILGYFGDLGLKAALIRKRGDLEPTELATAQKVILGISVTFAVVIGALLPLALRLVKLGPENYLPAAIFLVLLVVRNQRTVPLAMLERAMRFKVVSAVEAAESLIYTVLLATLAYLHKGIWCYVVAMGCRDLFGSVAFNLIVRPPSAAVLLGFAAAACWLQPGVSGRLAAEHDYAGISAHHDRAPARQERRWICVLGIHSVALSPGDLQCHGAHLSTGIQQRRRRSRTAARARGEIVAHQCQHCLAGLRGAGQPEHAHHRLYLHSQVVSRSACAVRLLR